MKITVGVTAVMKVSKNQNQLKEIKVKKAIHNRAMKANKNKKRDQNKKDQDLNLRTTIIFIQKKKEKIKDLVEETKRLNINKIKN